MKQYTITKVTGTEVICKEVNPLGKRPDGWGLVKPETMGATATELLKWQEAENNLKEYPLTEESKYTIDQWVEYGYTTNGERIPIHLNRTLRDFKVGQVINGEVIFDSVTDKVKVI